MSGIIDHRSYHYNTYRHGIISIDCLVRKYSDVEVNVQMVCTGTFVQVLSIKDEDVLFCIVDDYMQADTTQFICKKCEIIHVPENLWGPLFTVEKSARLPLVRDSKVAESIGNIGVGHSVQVLGPGNTVICTAKVTFRNSISKLGVGIYFGLQVMAPAENLPSIIKKVSLIEPGTKGFPRGCDVVVTIDKLRPYNKEKTINHYDKENQKHLAKGFSSGEDVNNSTLKSMIVLNLKDKISNNFKKAQHINSPDSEINLNHSSVKKIINSENPLNVGDEVVYLDGDIPEKGVVKWIGLVGSSLRVGVEFDNPIGRGTSKVDGVELFKAKHQHGLVVPPVSLIKLTDFVISNTKETMQLKKNNNNNNLNNINNNNNNINNNGVCNNLRSKNDFCCDGKQSVEEKYEKPKKVSIVHQCLKHPERTFDCNDPFHGRIKEEVHEGKDHFMKPAEHKSNCSFEMELQHNSKSFDFSKPNERKMGYRRNCNSMDDGQMVHAEVHPKVPSHWSPPSHDVFDFAGVKQEKSSSCYYANEKLQKGFDDVFASHKTVASHANEIKKEYIDKDNWSSQYSEHSSSDENLGNFYDHLKTGHSSYIPQDLERGSVVELPFKNEPHYGVIRWIGTLPDERDEGVPCLFAGIEMEEECSWFTDGTYKDKRYFQCNPKKALFIPLSKCRKDSRFLDETQRQNLSSKINYGQIDCPIVEGIIPPLNRKGDIESICGKNRGIQGHHNSCYLDATLFSMFAFTSVFDSLLYRPPTKNDIPQYTEVQRVLREEIVNPLRKNLYVRADRVMKLRTLLDKLSSVSGLTSEEKDPEEFLNSLLAQILKAEPFLKLSSGQEAFHYQLFVEKDERLVLPSVQQLFEQSFVTSDIKLKQVPSCLIIQMPRFGKSFKMYSRILPPQLLDITDIIENSPRQCTVCGKLAEFECKDCFGQHGIGNGLESISFCKSCLGTAHNHHCRSRHNSRSLTVPVEFSELQEHCAIPRLYMELFAVVCIETSHYVAFVKCGSASDAPWCFFDSMADRKGEQNGYNIPEMVPCPDLPYWLSEDGAKMLNEMRDERQLPEHAKRLFSDAYMCMYQSPDLMMYR